MKKNKLWLMVSIFVAAVLVLVACGGGAEETNSGETDNADVSEGEAEEFGLDENGRFIEQRTISVGLWDRNDSRIPNFDESHWAEWVAESMLEEYNVVIEWQPVSRWEEDEFQATQLGAGNAADVGVTFDNAMITTIAEMGAIHNLYPVLQQYDQLLPNLNGLLGDNVYHNLDSVTEELWTITGLNNNATNGRTSTWIREDWLEALDLPIPTTLEEFEETLIAFRDRADELPGIGQAGEIEIKNDDGEVIDTVSHTMTEADVIPMMITQDVGWDASTLFDSLIPSDITEREWFIHGFDDRRFMFEDAMREGTRILNRWYDEDLIFDDFVIVESKDAQDRIRLGHVGATIANWDMPFRGGDGWTTGTTGIHANIGENANYIPILPFLNEQGEVQQFVPQPTDRFIFLPSTNDEVLASLLYLDFMSRPDTIRYLQIGQEGIHHEILEDGSISMLPQDDLDGEWVQPSGMNFDITLTVNNMGAWQFDGDEDVALNTLSRAYPGIEPESILHAREIGTTNNIMFRNVSVGRIESEDGMSGPLGDIRDQIFHRMIANTAPENFDSAWESEYQVYLDMGGRAIIEEREQAWLDTFGDVDEMPED